MLFSIVFIFCQNDSNESEVAKLIMKVFKTLIKICQTNVFKLFPAVFNSSNSAMVTVRYAKCLPNLANGWPKWLVKVKRNS